MMCVAGLRSWWKMANAALLPRRSTCKQQVQQQRLSTAARAETQLWKWLATRNLAEQTKILQSLLFSSIISQAV